MTATTPLTPKRSHHGSLIERPTMAGYRPKTAQA